MITLKHKAAINASFEGINRMVATCFDEAKANGWHDFEEDEGQFISRAVSNMHGEVTELWEAYRNGELHKPCDKAQKMEAAGIEPLSCAEEELADIAIRLFDNAGRLGVDLERAIKLKFAFNSTRGYRHGGKKA